MPPLAPSTATLAWLYTERKTALSQLAIQQLNKLTCAETEKFLAP